MAEELQKIKPDRRRVRRLTRLRKKLTWKDKHYKRKEAKGSLTTL